MRTEYTLRSRIDKLNRGLKLASPRLGYDETRQGNRTTKFTVHTMVLGDRDIPVQAGQIVPALEKLLREMENLARHYKPSLLLPPPRKIPLWANPNARAFASGHIPISRGVHRFGKEILIPPGNSRRTKEQIFFATGDGGLEAYRYFPIDEAAYKGSEKFEAAMDWNRSMYNYVETQGFAPSAAREKLVSLNKQLIRQLILELAGWVERKPVTATDYLTDGGSLGATNDIMKELVKILK